MNGPPAKPGFDLSLPWADEQAWPDWKDSGLRVLMKLPGGRLVSGVLFAGDEFWTGEAEVPLFRVITDAGEDLSFADHEAWRFVNVSEQG